MLNAAPIEVTNEFDSGPGSLRDAILLANSDPAPDVIRFASDVREIRLDSELIINEDLTIRGPGARRLTIYGENEEGDRTRVFRVEPSLDGPINVAIRNLTITKGLATDAPGFPPIFAFGGGLYNQGNHVTLVGVTMSGNQAGTGAETPLAAGGAVANEFGGTLIVQRSRFYDNLSLGNTLGVGGAIAQAAIGEGDQAVSPNLTIEHSSFKGNTAHALETNPATAGDFAPFAGFALGGAILNVGGVVNVTHSSFIDNEAESGVGVDGSSAGAAIGGAIFSDDFSPFVQAIPPATDSLLDVSHSKFIGNFARGGTGNGGGTGGSANGGALGISIAYFPEAGSVRHSLFRDNVAEAGNGGSNDGEGGRGVGGAIAVLAGAEVRVDHSLFSSNEARGGAGAGSAAGGEARGGAIGLAPLITSDGSDIFDGLLPSVEIRNGLFRQNLAAGGAGGDDGGAGGHGRGGAIGLADEAAALIVRSILMRNTAEGGRGGALGGNGGDGQGGGIFNGDSTADLAHSIVLKNWAEGGSAGSEDGDDGLGQGGGIYNDTLGQFDVERSLIKKNRASDEGDNVFGDLI